MRAPATDKITIDPKTLTPEARKKLDRLVRPRDTVFSRKFAAADVARWRRAAAAADQSMTEWIEVALNGRAAQVLKEG